MSYLIGLSLGESQLISYPIPDSYQTLYLPRYDIIHAKDLLSVYNPVFPPLQESHQMYTYHELNTTTTTATTVITKLRSRYLTNKHHTEIMDMPLKIQVSSYSPPPSSDTSEVSTSPETSLPTISPEAIYCRFNKLQTSFRRLVQVRDALKNRIDSKIASHNLMFAHRTFTLDYKVALTKHLNDFLEPLYQDLEETELELQKIDTGMFQIFCELGRMGNNNTAGNRDGNDGDNGEETEVDTDVDSEVCDEIDSEEDRGIEDDKDHEFV